MDWYALCICNQFYYNASIGSCMIILVPEAGICREKRITCHRILWLPPPTKVMCTQALVWLEKRIYRYSVVMYVYKNWTEQLSHVQWKFYISFIRKMSQVKGDMLLNIQMLQTTKRYVKFAKEQIHYNCVSKEILITCNPHTKLIGCFSYLREIRWGAV